MKQLSASIERFAAAADRLEKAGARAVRRAEAKTEGAAAQGAIIAQLRAEIRSLQTELQAGTHEERREELQVEEMPSPARAAG